MEDVDGPADVEPLSALPGTSRLRVGVESVLEVVRVERLDRTVGSHRSWRDVGQHSTVRTAEFEVAIGLPAHLGRLRALPR
jgi:hypothetical protein